MKTNQLALVLQKSLSLSSMKNVKSTKIVSWGTPKKDVAVPDCSKRNPSAIQSVYILGEIAHLRPQHSCHHRNGCLKFSPAVYASFQCLVNAVK